MEILKTVKDAATQVSAVASQAAASARDAAADALKNGMDATTETLGGIVARQELQATVTGEPTPGALTDLLSALKESQLRGAAKVVLNASRAENEAPEVVTAELLEFLRSCSVQHLDRFELTDFDQRATILWCEYVGKIVAALGERGQLPDAVRARLAALETEIAAISAAAPSDGIAFDRLPTAAARLCAGIYAAYTPEAQAAFKQALIEDAAKLDIDLGAKQLDDVESLILGNGQVSAALREPLLELIEARVSGTLALLMRAGVVGVAAGFIVQRAALGLLGPAGLVIGGLAAVGSFAKSFKEREAIIQFVVLLTVVLLETYHNKLEAFLGGAAELTTMTP